MSKWAVHKSKDRFWKKPVDLKVYIEEMENVGYELKFIDNKTYYWRQR